MHSVKWDISSLTAGQQGKEDAEEGTRRIRLSQRRQITVSKAQVTRGTMAPKSCARSLTCSSPALEPGRLYSACIYVLDWLCRLWCLEQYCQVCLQLDGSLRQAERHISQ